ncbi:hypothetical protein FKP32DRAFT_1671081 [Trametes sanguinea]|nr:hypothetical protein FKP32DRAFT_1671081 [Trametes sanguinea]
MPSQDLLRDFDAVATSLGVTPVLDQSGNPIPIGPQEGTDAIYVVWIGRGIGLFRNWGLTQAMVWGFSGCAYKKYHGLDNALTGWFQGPTRMQGQWRVPSPRRPLLTTEPPPPPPSTNTPAPPKALHDQLPREVQVSNSPTSGVHVALKPSTPDSDEEYWSYCDDTINDIEDAVPTSSPSPPPSPTLYPASTPSRDQIYSARAPITPPSPTISSVSSFPLSSLLSDGTISPRTIHTPLLASPASQPSSLKSVTSSLARLTVASPASPSPLQRKPIHSERLNKAALMNSAGRAASTTGKADRDVFVVVRGDQPGIYFDRSTAIEVLGTKPGMKMVRFSSLSRASWYFVQEYMAGHVGVPVLTMPLGDRLEEA